MVGRDDADKLEGEKHLSIDGLAIADRAREEAETSPRIRRFLPEERDPRLREKKRLERQLQQALSELQQRLRDPEYRAAWDSANEAIDRAQIAVDQAIEENTDLLDVLEDRAPKLADGRAVYLNPDGTGRTKDGETISLAEMALLTIPKDAPTWDEYETAWKRQAELAQKSEKIDRARTTVNDPNNPAEKPELEDITKDMDIITRDAEGRPILQQSFNPVALPPVGPPALDFDTAPVQSR